VTTTAERHADRVHGALDAQTEAERRRAVRALLRTPLLRAGDPAWSAVRRHAAWLRDWFAREAGWHLQVDPEVVRLRKIAGDLTDGTRPAVTGGSRSAAQPLRRRRYVLLCLALAALERSDAQTTLGRLAEAVQALATDPALAAAGVTVDLEVREDRGDLAAAVTVLLDLGVLARVAGDETGYVSGSGDALYDVDRRVLAGLLVTRRGPSAVPGDGGLDDRLRAVTEEPAVDADEARTRVLRHRLTRRLLDDPAVHYEDLSEDELAYLHGQRSRLLRTVAEATGLVAEVRAEGIAMVDHAGRDALTDVRMPEEGTEGHVTLLLADHLVARDRAGAGPVPLAELQAHVARLAVEHRSHWRRDATAPGAEVALTAQAVSRLVALRLARRVDSAVQARPVLARYAFGPALQPGGQAS
jgi:uncharacterized protein (TIGR02678 family)